MKAGGTTVNVRYANGAYVARGGGRTASCTVDADAAICALAVKLGMGSRARIVDRQQILASHIRCTLRQGGGA
jgi:hypothetical protein